MAAKSTLYNIFNDLVGALKEVVPAKYIRLKDRPKLSDADGMIPQMAVIDLPLTISDYVIGDGRTMLETNGVFYLLVLSKKDGTLDVTPTGNLIDSVYNLFPIKGEYCVATNPEIHMMGDDGQGYQVTVINFDLRCRWKAFEQ